MNFGKGASNFTINGGNFNNIEGDYTEYNYQHRHVTNIGSNNMYNNKVTSSFNDSSKRFSSPKPRSRPVRVHDDDDDDEMGAVSEDDRGEDNHKAGPPPRKNDAPTMNMSGDENNSESDDSDSSSSHSIGVQGSTRMTDSSFRGSMPSSTSRDKSHSQTTNPSPRPRPAFSSVNHPMNPSSPFNLRPNHGPPYPSRSSPSVSPHMKRPAMANPLSQSTASQQDETHEAINPDNGPPPVSTPGFNLPPRSSGGPNLRNNYGNFTKHDTTNVYETNISSFNTANNTIHDSFNDNSLVNSLGKRKAGNKKPESSGRN